MKKYTIAIVTAMITAAVTFPAFAGWEQDGFGWWYKHQDGSYTKNNWEQIDGKYYYFDGNGYMMHDVITPDGYVVGPDGAWMQNIKQGKTYKTAEHVNENANQVEESYGSNTAEPQIVGNVYHGPEMTEKEKERITEKKTSYKSRKTESKYESIYKTYRKKLEKCDGDIDDLAELCNEGVSKMAEVCVNRGADDYDTYSKWAQKLYDVYQKIGMRKQR